MTRETKEALAKFCDEVAVAIARQCNGKDVAYQNVLLARDRLNEALEREQDEPHSHS